MRFISLLIKVKEKISRLPKLENAKRYPKQLEYGAFTQDLSDIFHTTQENASGWKSKYS